ncbi:MAG: putative GTP-binding protein EngB [Firmicutes bacterium]|nr:putative GTP-binding protein EngB [candidate division NPL-UPA2 bacterium]MBT9154510.1 putative GTP-binding protein EngB [candidate division NPL-UPA2 bacterium]
MFKVVSAELVTSVLELGQMPAGALPEIAIIGRSNVGKSSLINSLLSRRALARISSQPGKTRLMNFYLINEALYLVDVPGYGYAKFSQAERAATRQRLQDYLQKRHQLRLILQLVDIRHAPSPDDCAFHLLVKNTGIPVKVVATKADKVVRSRLAQHLKVIGETLSIAPEEVIVTSSQGKGGIDLLWSHVLTEH